MYGGTVLGCAIWTVGNSDPVGRWPDTTDWEAISRDVDRRRRKGLTRPTPSFQPGTGASKRRSGAME
jgi:hypothetical protein